MTAGAGPHPRARRGARLRPRPLTAARSRRSTPAARWSCGWTWRASSRHVTRRADRRAAAHRGLPDRGGRGAGRAAGDRARPPPCCGPRPPRERAWEPRRRLLDPARRAAPAPGRTHRPPRRPTCWRTGSTAASPGSPPPSAPGTAATPTTWSSPATRASRPRGLARPGRPRSPPRRASGCATDKTSACCRPTIASASPGRGRQRHGPRVARRDYDDAARTAAQLRPHRPRRSRTATATRRSATTCKAASAWVSTGRPHAGGEAARAVRRDRLVVNLRPPAAGGTGPRTPGRRADAIASITSSVTARRITFERLEALVAGEVQGLPVADGHPAQAREPRAHRQHPVGADAAAAGYHRRPAWPAPATRHPVCPRCSRPSSDRVPSG